VTGAGIDPGLLITGSFRLPRNVRRMMAGRAWLLLAAAAAAGLVASGVAGLTTSKGTGLSAGSPATSACTSRPASWPRAPAQMH
jgi:hypothetical protein